MKIQLLYLAPSYLKQGNDTDVAQLIADMNAGNIAALITYNVNPSYSFAECSMDIIQA